MAEHPSIPGIPAARALVVLREPTEARRIAAMFEAEGVETVAVADDAAGYGLLDTEQIDILISETRADRVDGLRLLRIAKMRNPDICAVLVASPGDVGLATRAMGEGAHDFQVRPLNLEKIQAVVRRGLETQRLVGQMNEMARRLDRKFGFRNLIGNSAPMARLYNQMLQVCGSDAPVLITGEPGTGRELVASVIHHNSPRRRGPFVRMDCGGFEAGYLEKDLFGHALPAGEGLRPGRIEQAEGGSLLLDSVEDLPLPVQGRLLRLIRDNEYEPIGGGRTMHADARILAIGSNDLRSRVLNGDFRGDLHDHLRAVTLSLPALRHRRRDIPLLIDRFLLEAREETGKSVERIEPGAIERLVRYSWPGNVRELKAVVRGVVLSAADGRTIGPGDLPEEIRSGAEGSGEDEIRVPIGTSLRSAERRLVEATLAWTGGDRRRAARVLGIGLRTLQRRLAEYGRGRSHSANARTRQNGMA